MSNEELKLIIEENAKEVNRNILSMNAKFSALLIQLKFTSDEVLDFYNLSNDILQKNLEEYGLLPDKE